MAELDVDPVAAALTAAVRDAASPGSAWTVLYSGGLDSSLVAHLVPDPPGCRLLVVGLPGARDLDAAASGATALGRELRTVPLELEEVRRVVDDASWEVSERPEPWRSVRAALVLALLPCRGGRALVGQGADELFYGYAHFSGSSSASDRERAAADLNDLRTREWPWTERIARRLGVVVRAPFLDERVIAAARALPPPDRGHGEGPKHYLRRAARTLGLPEEIVGRPKRALQYGSGVARAVERLL